MFKPLLRHPLSPRICPPIKVSPYLISKTKLNPGTTYPQTSRIRSSSLRRATHSSKPKFSMQSETSSYRPTLPKCASQTHRRCWALATCRETASTVVDGEPVSSRCRTTGLTGRSLWRPPNFQLIGSKHLWTTSILKNWPTANGLP